MRTAHFEVPSEYIGDFTEKLTETGLENTITGRNDEDEIEIKVYYDKSDVHLVDELEEEDED